MVVQNRHTGLLPIARKLLFNKHLLKWSGTSASLAMYYLQTCRATLTTPRIYLMTVNVSLAVNVSFKEVMKSCVWTSSLSSAQKFMNTGQNGDPYT